jgi:Flp pilus assembly protein TadB
MAAGMKRNVNEIALSNANVKVVIILKWSKKYRRIMERSKSLPLLVRRLAHIPLPKWSKKFGRTMQRNKFLPLSVKSLVHIANLALMPPLRLLVITFSVNSALLIIYIVRAEVAPCARFPSGLPLYHFLQIMIPSRLLKHYRERQQMSKWNFHQPLWLQ